MYDLLRVADLEREELLALLELAATEKADRRAFAHVARTTAVAVLFEKPSLRTRFSVEVACVRVGAHPIGAYDAQIGLGTREPIEDAARVLDRYVDAVIMRTFEHARIEALAEAAAVPVVNALTDRHHPLQALADLLTVVEHVASGDVRGLKDTRIVYLGDGNNVAHSLIEAGALSGASIAVGCPPGYEPDPEIVSWATSAGGEIEIIHDPTAAVRGANAVYTDVWTSMGQEEEAATRRRTFEPYRVTPEIMGHAAPGAVFLHCLPAHRGEEVDAAVIDGEASRVFDQAENRVHTTAAVLARLLGGM